MQICAPSKILHVLYGSGSVLQRLSQHVADSVINGGDAESHTGLAAFSTMRYRCLRAELDLAHDSTPIHWSHGNPLRLCVHLKE